MQDSCILKRTNTGHDIPPEQTTGIPVDYSPNQEATAASRAPAEGGLSIRTTKKAKQTTAQAFITKPLHHECKITSQQD